VAVGSRLISNCSSHVERVWHRRLFGQIFAGLARHLLGLPVRDSQCGFKMFRRSTALRLCEVCQESGYLFDVEVLAWAQRLGYRVAEVAVSWREMPGSKVRVLRDGLIMLLGLCKLWYSMGNFRWRSAKWNRRPFPRP
jgi:dolichyl-phosphate beta-glucosyltransferase